MNHMPVLLVLLVGLVIVKETNGEPCKCGTYANCLIDGTCVCNPGYHGNATFNCYPSHSLYCGITNDPVIRLYGGQVSSIKIPASVCMTQVSTYRSGGGQCKFGLSAWTKQYGAKHYISGMEFMLTQIIWSTRYIDRFHVTGRVDDHGNYEWVVRHFLSKKRWDTYKINKASTRALVKWVHTCKISFLKTPVNFLVVNIECCRKIQFALRPHNPLDAATTPGAWVTIPRSMNYDNIKPLPQNVCGSMKKYDTPIEDLAKDLGFKHKYQYMTYAGLVYGVPVNYPRAFKDLSLLQQTLIFCNKFKRSRFMKRTDFVFTFGRLIKCLGSRIMDLTYDIAKGFCLSDGKSCINAINTIRQRCPSLVNATSKVRQFMKNGCV